MSLKSSTLQFAKLCCWESEITGIQLKTLNLLTHIGVASQHGAHAKRAKLSHGQLGGEASVLHQKIGSWLFVWWMQWKSISNKDS
jgi:hypothetical protein